MLVRAKIICGICGGEILGNSANDPRDRRGEKERTDEIEALARGDHQSETGHWPTGDFVLVEALEPEVIRKFIPSEKPPLPRKKEKKSSPGDGDGTHSGPSRDRKPHLVVVESPEDTEQRRRDQASVRDSGSRRAARAK